MAPFELSYRKVKDDDVTDMKLDILKINMKRIAFNSCNKYKFARELNISNEEFTALKGLASGEDLVIHKSDKRNSVVVLNKEVYMKRMKELISDRSKFQHLDVVKGKEYNFMVKETGDIKDFLDTLETKGSITEKVKKEIEPCGPSPGRLYGLSKVHKDLIDGIPKMRPIISQINSPTYKIAKYLVQFITPFTTNQYTVKDSFEFSSIINDQNHQYFMASFDIESLFTNVPLDESIGIIVQHIYGNKRKVNNIWKGDFRKLLYLSTKGSIFMFDGAYYRQIDGVAMGSPLGPAIANTFLCHYEGEWINSCDALYAPMLYKRYVDDIFLLFNSYTDVLPFSEFMNSRHPNINFTHEVEKDGVLAFLDINIFREGGKFVTSIHRKATFSGVYSNFCSFIPKEYKFGLIMTLLHRCFSLVSNYELFHKEIEKLKEIIRNNAYPPKFIDKCIFVFLNKIHREKRLITTVPKKEVNIILPFLGSLSLQIRSRLIKSFNKSIPHAKIKVIFKTSVKLGSYFRFKDIFPSSLRSHVIYKYKCRRCNSTYVGKTKRYWEKRLEEHLSTSALTGKPLKPFKVWPPKEHDVTCDC